MTQSNFKTWGEKIKHFELSTPVVITGSWSKQNADVTARNSRTLNKKGDPSSPVTQHSTCEPAGNLLPGDLGSHHSWLWHFHPIDNTMAKHKSAGKKKKYRLALPKAVSKQLFNDTHKRLKTLQWNIRKRWSFLFKCPKPQEYSLFHDRDRNNKEVEIS